jgi:hypothetical protein
MPVVFIYALPPPEPERVDVCLSAVVHAITAAIHCAPETVWAHWVDVRAMHIGERPQDFDGHCPAIVIRARPGRSTTAVASALQAVAEAAALALDVPVEDVWACWENTTPGAVFSGGTVHL